MRLRGGGGGNLSERRARMLIRRRPPGDKRWPPEIKSVAPYWRAVRYSIRAADWQQAAAAVLASPFGRRAGQASASGAKRRRQVARAYHINHLVALGWAHANSRPNRAHRHTRGEPRI
jgi:hypothetical protein